MLGQKAPVLEKVGSVGVQGVAREPPLKLQLGEEVEDQPFEAVGGGTGGSGPLGRGNDVHGAWFLQAGAFPLPRKRRPGAWSVA